MNINTIGSRIIEIKRELDDLIEDIRLDNNSDHDDIQLYLENSSDQLEEAILEVCFLQGC